MEAKGNGSWTNGFSVLVARLAIYLNMKVLVLAKDENMQFLQNRC